MNAGDALGFGKLLFDLGARIYEAVAHRDFDRVERILPATLRTTLARAVADAEAEERFARRDEPTVPVRIPDGGEAEP